MQATPIDLNAQQFFQPYVAQSNARSEMIQQGKLTWFVRCLEGDGVKTELLCEAVRQSRVEVAFVVEKAYPFGALTGLYNQFARTGFQPAMSLRNQLLRYVGIE